MTAVLRLLASSCVGVAHFLLALMLGPGSACRCASIGDCIVDLSGDFPAHAIFALPLSLTGSHLSAIFSQYPFAFYASINAVAIPLLLWGTLSVLARWRQPKIEGNGVG